MSFRGGHLEEHVLSIKLALVGYEGSHVVEYIVVKMLIEVSRECLVGTSLSREVTGGVAVGGGYVFRPYVF